MAAHREGLELGLGLRTYQLEAGLTALTGHRIFAKLDEAQARLSAAISDAAHSHSLLRRLAPKVGVAPAMFGERTDPEEEDAAVRRASGHLTAVA